MVLSHIYLKNIRKHENLKVTFANKLNYIVGRNGVGKTTILESIYYLCTSKSCISKQDVEVLSFGKDSFEISGEFTELTRDNVKVMYSALENKKQYLLNHKPIQKAASVIGNFPVILLTPADRFITQGGPADRRKFVDSVISQSTKTYLKILLEYNRILKQRAYLLIKIRDGKNNDTLLQLEAWTQKLMQNGIEIINYRKKFTEKFKSYISESYKRIMGSEEIPDVTYSYLGGYQGNELNEQFALSLNERKDDEIRRAANLVGPHRDEFIFLLDGKPLRSFGSQGQHKTFQVSLRFAEFFYIRDLTGKTPVFLLDDVFGELDANRTSKISSYLSEVGQAFITLTDFGNFSFLKTGSEDKIVKINNGSNAYA